jgi:cation transport protein ChaC
LEQVASHNETTAMIKKKDVRSRTLTLTQELVARVERVEPDPGPEPGTSEHTEAELKTMVEELLQEHTPQHLWVFAYGSLIWNPEFEVVESRPAVASGWHRSFCLKLTRWVLFRCFTSTALKTVISGGCKNW